VPPSRAGPSAAASGRCGTGRPRAAAKSRTTSTAPSPVVFCCSMARTSERTPPQIRHPNVVEVFWTGQIKAGDWYLITEFIDS
jgi:hypothetical protein